MKRLLNYSALLLCSAFLYTGTSCKKETNCNGVPNVSVNFSVNLLNIGNPQLVPIGNNETFSGGYINNGVLVYHYTQSQFQAYDCTCPYDGQANAKAIVTATQGGLYATCPVCGSSFLLSNGSPNKGPSSCPLKAYSTSYDNTSNTVYVSN
jgi:nitrite reductase/ring-hydroxylating ferredoxin subunit